MMLNKPLPSDATDLKLTQFGMIKVSDWFKESPDGSWYIKTSSNHGFYRANGVTGQPLFLAGEEVFVPANQ
jgi:hypothetical protein